MKDKDTGISMTRRTLLGAAPFFVAAAGLGAERAGAAEMPLKAANADKFPPLSPFKFSLETSNSRWDGPGGTAREVNTSNFPISRSITTKAPSPDVSVQPIAKTSPASWGETSREEISSIKNLLPVSFAVIETPHVFVENLMPDTIEDTIDNLMALGIFESVFVLHLEEKLGLEININTLGEKLITKTFGELADDLVAIGKEA